VLEGEFREGDTVLVDAKGDSIVLSKQEVSVNTINQ
jgi:hypothetical protein